MLHKDDFFLEAKKKKEELLSLGQRHKKHKEFQFSWFRLSILFKAAKPKATKLKRGLVYYLDRPP